MEKIKYSKWMLVTLAAASLLCAPGFAAETYATRPIRVLAGGAPAGTPKVIVNKLNHEIAAIERVPDTRARLDVIGFDPVSNTPDEFMAYVKTEVVKWAKVIKDSGAHID